MRHQDQRGAAAQELLDAMDALLLELEVADREHLVEQQDVGLDVGGDGEAQPPSAAPSGGYPAPPTFCLKRAVRASVPGVLPWPRTMASSAATGSVGAGWSLRKPPVSKSLWRRYSTSPPGE